MNSVQKSLVAFDTDHIKEYVFGTDRLKEIRGASSLLDRLNRHEMKAIAHLYDIEDDAIIYKNGGSGLFVVSQGNAEKFGKHVQQRYRELTGGGASITFVVQPLPNDAPDDLETLLDYDFGKAHTLELMRYKLRERKLSPPDVLTLSSHPFMRPCDACGIFYAEEDHEIGESGTFYCASCWKKRKEDEDFKNQLGKKGKRAQEYLWGRISSYLDQVGYVFDQSQQVERPNDFNEFRQFAESKEYIGLIYADGNSMGTSIEKINTLRELRDFAHCIDEAIFLSMCQAIKAYLPVVEIERSENGKKKQVSVFPFDILLVGGDDIVMVTDAAKVIDVSLEIAQKFRTLTKNQHSLSIGVVLAPVKYPFGLLQDMAESALKFAKKVAADERAKAKDPDQFDGTRINFQVVTGGSKPDFSETYKEIYRRVIDDSKHLDFHASLRPYKPKDLEHLLKAIREGHKLNLGRSKLHQLREAVFDKNLTTSVQKGLAALHNWRGEKQRAHVVGEVYAFGSSYQIPRSDPRDPVSGFPRVTFPWFADGEEKGRAVYRTPLLDFIELYDFVAREGESNDEEA